MLRILAVIKKENISVPLRRIITDYLDDNKNQIS